MSVQFRPIQEFFARIFVIKSDGSTEPTFGRRGQAQGQTRGEAQQNGEVPNRLLALSLVVEMGDVIVVDFSCGRSLVGQEQPMTKGSHQENAGQVAALMDVLQ